MTFSDDEEIVFGDDIDPEAEMAAAEDAASDRALKQQEEALRIKLKSKKRPQEELSSDEDDSSTYEPPKQQKKQKSSGRASGSGLSRGIPEPKNSETFPSSMWPAGMTAQQVNKFFVQ